MMIPIKPTPDPRSKIRFSLMSSLVKCERKSYYKLLIAHPGGR
jgi:hypothetical protein